MPNIANKGVPFWSLYLIQILHNRDLVTGFFPSRFCSVFRKLKEVANDILKRYNVNLLANQLVLVQSFLCNVASSKVYTQLQVLVAT